MNFMNSLRSKDTVEEPMSASNDVEYSTKGFKPAIDTVYNVDKMHLY